MGGGWVFGACRLVVVSFPGLVGLSGLGFASLVDWLVSWVRGFADPLQPQAWKPSVKA